MKQLNAHLENRLQEQESRLCLVTTELGKTWHVVGKLRRHHFQLHTHEKILKYELQQKRKLLNEIKEELEYCREKWEQAREKNNQSEKDWRKLRAEFSSRNSGESGYSDERLSDESSESNDESEYVAEPPIRCKKKMKKSFETILDSSNAAEREDPVSDLLDVAELSLDTQGTNENHDSSSECSKSENILKCENNFETEDEQCDIAHDDSCIEDQTIEHQVLDARGEDSSDGVITVEKPPEPSTSSSINLPLIDPATILLNIRRQNEMLAKKDARLESLEKSSAALLKKTQVTSKICQEIDNTLEHLINRPSLSTQDLTENTNKSVSQTSTECIAPEEIHNNDIDCIIIDDDVSKAMHTDSTILNPSTDDATAEEITNMQSDNTPSNIDFRAILENVKQQNERLSKKDKRLENLEKECIEVVADISNTLNSGQVIIEKLDALHSAHIDPMEQNGSTNNLPTETGNNIEEMNLSEPSTSTEIDHEARFAARDLRLKRLEEQTKSLVKKVNKTTSKGVKINYKLEELHNIYGSENSRAGTPSEETEERSNSEDTDSNNESEPSTK